MPVIRRKPQEPHSRPDLVKRLAEELKQDKSGDAGGEEYPKIIEEEVRLSDHFHVTVIWDEWKDLSPEERSCVILDAYRRQLGEARMLQITLALGMTIEAAEKLGID